MPLDNFLSQLTFPIATWVSKHYVYFIDVKTEEQNGHILATQWQSKIWTQPFMGPGRKCPVSFFCCCCYAYPVGQAQKTPNVMVSQIRPCAQNSSFKATTFAKFLWLLRAGPCVLCSTSLWFGLAVTPQPDQELSENKGQVLLILASRGAPAWLSVSDKEGAQ